MTRKEAAEFLKPKQPKKYSETFYEFMKYAIADSEPNDKAFKKLLSWGEFIWNAGVAEDFPDHPTGKEINILFPLFKNTFPDKTLLNELIERKRTYFKNASFFVVIKNPTLYKDGRMEITVSAEECNLEE